MSADNGGLIAGTFDDVEKMLDAKDVSVVAVELGERGAMSAADVVRAAQALAIVIARIEPEQTLVLTIGGYDTDPRELFQVPEVVRFLRRVVKAAGITHWSHPAVRAMNEETLALLLQCGVFGTDHPWRVRHVGQREPTAAMFRRHGKLGPAP